MSKKWYIVHTYSGQENRAKKALLERAASLGFEEAIDAAFRKIARAIAIRCFWPPDKKVPFSPT